MAPVRRHWLRRRGHQVPRLLSWRLAPRPRRPGHQAMVQRRRQWCRAVGAAIATPGSGAGAAAHGTAAGFAKLWAARTLKCSCGSLVGLMLDVSQAPGRCPLLRRRQTGSRGTAPQASLELTLAVLLIWCQWAAQPLVQLTVPQGQKLVLVAALPWGETVRAARIPVAKPLCRGKGLPLLWASRFWIQPRRGAHGQDVRHPRRRPPR